MTPPSYKELKTLLDFVERWNKNDKEIEVARIAERLERFLDSEAVQEKCGVLLFEATAKSASVFCEQKKPCPDHPVSEGKYCVDRHECKRCGFLWPDEKPTEFEHDACDPLPKCSQCCWEVDDKWVGPCAHCGSRKPHPEHKECEIEWQEEPPASKWTSYLQPINANLIAIGKLLDRYLRDNK